MRVLIAEDNQLLGEGLCDTLHDEGETVDWVQNGREAVHALQSEHFDLLVLDLGLPGIDGLAVLQSLRNDRAIQVSNRSMPVLILTARGQTEDRVRGLDAGADDYLVKPFEITELLARLRALKRRSGGRASAAINIDGLAIDTSSRAVRLDGETIELSRREYALLSALAEQRGQILSKRQLTEVVYGWATEVESNALEVHIHNLRRKLGGRFIRTVRGAGYKLDVPTA